MALEPIAVYTVSGSPYSWRVLLALEAKRLSYEHRVLDFSRGDTKAPEFLALNPRGKVPVLRHGAFVLYESLAIIDYLDRVFPERPVLGTAPKESALLQQRISEFNSYLRPPIETIGGPLVFGFKPGDAEVAIPAATERLHAELARFEAMVAGGGCLAGPSLTAADFVAYPFVKFILRLATRDAAQPLNLGLLPFASRYPKLAAWLRRVEAMPGYERTYPQHWGRFVPEAEQAA